MAWKPQGGGPWGGGGNGGGQGPWGSGGGQGGGNGGGNGGGRGPSGGQGPDIEEMLRRSQQNLKNSIPGGFGNKSGVLLLVLAAVALWLLSGIFRVDSGHKGVALMFGKYDYTADPGLHWYFPAPIGEVMTPNVEQIRRVDVGFVSPGESGFGSSAPTGRDVPEESQMLTGDQNIADVDFTVQWKVREPGSFLFNIRDPETTVKLAAESAMREVIGQTTLQDAMTGGRQQVADRTRILTQDILDSYDAGITVTLVQLLKVDPPKDVIDAFNEVQRARQDKDRKVNEAQAYKNQVVPTARGEADRMLNQAEAYKERIIKEAQGEAERFQSIYDTYVADKDITRERLYLETMEEILQGADKVVIDSQAGSGVVPYMALPELKKGGTK